jgi:hypothetical protein
MPWLAVPDVKNSHTSRKGNYPEVTMPPLAVLDVIIWPLDIKIFSQR